jgi:hypothetical protein
MQTIFSFKIMRLLYSKFFGNNLFWAAFEKKSNLIDPINCVTIFNIIFSMLPMIGIGVMGIIEYSWGNQLYIMFCESLLIEIIMIIFIIIEFKTYRIY